MTIFIQATQSIDILGSDLRHTQGKRGSAKTPATCRPQRLASRQNQFSPETETEHEPNLLQRNTFQECNMQSDHDISNNEKMMDTQSSACRLCFED